MSEPAAEFLVFWPGNAVYMCVRHYQQAQQVAEAMGFLLEARPAFGVCTNCQNEASWNKSKSAQPDSK